MNDAHVSGPGQIDLDRLGPRIQEAIAADNLTEAARLASIACDANREDPDAWLLLGAISSKLDMLDDAIRCVDHSIKLAPEYPESHLLRGQLLEKRDTPNFASAIASLTRATVLDPSYLEAWQSLARVTRNSGRFEEHLHCLERLVPLDPSEVSGHVRLAAIYWLQGALDRSVSCCRSALELDSECVDAHRLLARISLQLGDHDGAGAHYREMGRLQADDAEWAVFSTMDLGGLVEPRLRRRLMSDTYGDLAPWLRGLRTFVYGNEAAEAMVDLLKAEGNAAFSTALDIGCGTGGIGLELRNLAVSVTGIDISSPVLAQTRQTNAYDTLVQGDYVDLLRRADVDYDLLIAEDAFSHVPDLVSTFMLCRDALGPGGMLVFTVENAETAGTRMLQPGRYCHQPESINALARSWDFEVAAQRDIKTRDLGSRPVLATAYLLRKAESRSVEKIGTAPPSGTGPLPGRRVHEDVDMFQAAERLEEDGDSEGALDILSRLQNSFPSFAAAFVRAGLIAQNLGRTSESMRHLRRALELEPDNAIALLNLGNGYIKLEDYDPAAEYCHKAIEVEPHFAMAHNNLGFVRQCQERFDEAVQHYREALYWLPDLELARSNLVSVLRSMNPDVSLEQIEQRCNVEPDTVAGLLEWAVRLRERGLHERAIACLEKAVEMDPRNAELHLNLGTTRQAAGDAEQALVHLRTAVELDPDSWAVRNCLAGALKDTGRLDLALEQWDIALRGAGPKDAAAPNRLFCMNYHGGYSPAQLLAAHREWGDRLLDSLGPGPGETVAAPEPGRRLRIGYLSGDFSFHSVSAFSEPLLENHDHANFEIFCYSNVHHEDGMTFRLHRYADHWRRVRSLDDETIADMIRSDAIDILVDLSGHTGGSRLAVLAYRPAPIQATYLGYPNTTGLATVDYRISDSVADPPGPSDEHHVETLFRLPGCFLCYRPPNPAPPVRLRALPGRSVVFGCFNNLAKLQPEVLSLWGRILARAPGSTLLLKNHSFQYESARRRFRELFAGLGVREEQVEFSGPLDVDQHLDLYNQVDIALDPFPYNGTTTTCEAIWMGVPVIALAGERHAARTSASVLTAAGLDEMVVGSIEEYENLAVELAGDRPRLQSIKLAMRSRLRMSTLLNGAAFARKMESAYRTMWRRWCDDHRAGQPNRVKHGPCA